MNLNLYLALSLFFAGSHVRAASQPASIHCAVMSTNVVQIAPATKKGFFADYKGRRYFFCCNICVAAFKSSPQRFATSPSVAVPRP